VATGAILDSPRSSDGSSASFCSIDMTFPRVATAASPHPTLNACMSPHMHERGAAAAAVRGAASPPDVLQRVLGGVAVDPVIVAKVALQARLQESTSRQELEHERERTKALETMVRQLSMELSVARKAAALQADALEGK
jgi:hypothetical protein